MRFRFNIIFIVFLIGIGALVLLTRRMFMYPIDFSGVAENQVRNINIQFPVEIRTIDIVLGQKVDSGQLLCTLYRMDLPLKINELDYSIKEQEAKRWTAVEHLKYELDRLESRRLETATDFDQKIVQLETEQKIQSGIFNNLGTVDLPADKSNRRSDFNAQKITALREQKNIALQQLDIQIAQYKTDIRTAQEPMDINIHKMRSELDIIKKQQADLNLYAPQEGIIGELSFQPGEKVSPYSTIMKIYGSHPNVVTTYIGEGRLADIKMGDTLLVNSINDPNYVIPGVVEGLGTRVALLPERLRKIPDLKAWGREVQMSIPTNNQFLQGEKVRVTSRER